MRLYILSILFSLLTVSAIGRNFSNQEVKEDLNFLVQQIEQYNAALNAYNPDFHTQATAIVNSINDDSIAPLHYYGLVSSVCALSNEGHINIGGWDDDFRKGIPDGTYKYMPFSVDIISGRLYVRRDFTPGRKFQQGDEILSINNTPVSDILKELYRYIPTDDTITTHADRILSFVFPFYYYFYIAQPENFDIQYSSIKTGREQTVSLQARNSKAQESIYNIRYPEIAKAKKEESIADFYELKQEQSYVLLKLKSFNYKLVEQYHLKAHEFYENIFSGMKENKTANLIIDLRDNMGGRNEFADDIVPYIITKENNDPYLKKTISWEGKEKTYKLPRRHKHAYDGKIFVLVNGRTFSAASMLARYLKEYADAVIIGEETGTRYEGFAAGSTEYIKLPNSDLGIGLPRYHILFPVSQKQKTSNQGLLPDHKVENTIEDIIEEKDAVLDFAIGLIK